MASRTISPKSTSDKDTYIYGLIDPRTQELRYVGKTVLPIDKRLRVHLWRATKTLHRSHSQAWIRSLSEDGFKPDIFTIEEVQPGDDWAEREQFWIAYFRSIGSCLCNHTIGGDGSPGLKQSEESKRKRTEATRRPEARQRVSKQSKQMWAESRDKIIAAQNAGKGIGWRRKQSVLAKQRAARPESPLQKHKFRREKLTLDGVSEIRKMLADGFAQKIIAAKFGIDQSLVSKIRTGKRPYSS